MFNRIKYMVRNKLILNILLMVLLKNQRAHAKFIGTGPKQMQDLISLKYALMV